LTQRCQCDSQKARNTTACEVLRLPRIEVCKVLRLPRKMQPIF
jgi:hypothetical protein